MRSIVYDAGALVAAERRSPDLLALHDELTAAHVRPLVPVVVLAQVWRGGPQHPGRSHLASSIGVKLQLFTV